MFKETFDFVDLLREAGAVLLIGVVIKILDDLIDEPDPLGFWPNNELGRRTYAYGLVAMLVALALDFTLAASLFLASYSLGMFADLSNRLPSGMANWQEILLCWLLMIILLEPSLAVWSLAVVLVIQLLDDYLDQRDDYRRGLHNLVLNLGKVEALLVGTAVLGLAAFLQLRYTLLVLMAGTLLQILFSSQRQCEIPQEGRRRRLDGY